MNLSDVPLVSHISDAGTESPLYDSLLVGGPLLVGLIVLLGRSLVTELLAGAYIGVLVTYVLYRGIHSGE